MEIRIYKDFSEFPGLRNCDISENSGEAFYHRILNTSFFESLSQEEKLTINLDLTAGFASSFLDEAFGNLVFDFTLEMVRNNINIISEQEPHWKDMIENKTFLEWEERRVKGKTPRVTEEHEPWFRNVKGKIEKQVWEHPVVT